MRYLTSPTKRVFLFALSAAAGLIAQGPQTLIDNDSVRVIKVVDQPHAKNKLHDHKLNRVMVYLQAGRQDIDRQEGKKVAMEWKAGEVKWSPASGMHTSEIVSNDPVTIVEVEVKKEGDPSKTVSKALDPLKVDPKHYKLEFENSQVRVTRVKFGPKESAAMHEHVLNRVVIYLADQNARMTSADGKVDIAQHKPGEASWGTAVKHKEENLNDTRFEAVVVELKN